MLLGHHVSTRNQKGTEGGQIVACQCALGPRGLSSNGQKRESARQEFTSIGVLLCSLVIVYSREGESDRKGNNARQCFLGPRGLEFQWIKREMLGKIWQALVCHGVPWSSSIHLKPKDTKGKNKACQCTERPWTIRPGEPMDKKRSREAITDEPWCATAPRGYV